MTERPGGSDVSRTETIAARQGARSQLGLWRIRSHSLAFARIRWHSLAGMRDSHSWGAATRCSSPPFGPGGRAGGPVDGSWNVSGFKWFSSATDSDMTLLLARALNAEGATVAGSKGLSLYYARVRNDQGQLNGIRVQRLKNKFGTKALPTAELELDKMTARLVRAGPLGRRANKVPTTHVAAPCVGQGPRCDVEPGWKGRPRRRYHFNNPQHHPHPRSHQLRRRHAARCRARARLCSASRGTRMPRSARARAGARDGHSRRPAVGHV